MVATVTTMSRMNVPAVEYRSSWMFWNSATPMPPPPTSPTTFAKRTFVSRR